MIIQFLMDHKEIVPSVLLLISEILPLVTKKDVTGIVGLLVKISKSLSSGAPKS